MTQAYDYFSRVTDDFSVWFGVLLVSKDNSEVFHGGLICLSKENNMFTELFHSMKSEDDVILQAETWIKASLYSNFVRGPVRNQNK